MVKKSKHNNPEEVPIIEAEDLISIGPDEIDNRVQKPGKNKFQFVIIMTVIFFMICISLVFYFVERAPRAAIINDEVSELKSIVKTLQVELKEQKLENMALNSKILSIGTEFEDTDTALSENKTFNKEMFASLSKQILSISNSINEQPAISNVDEISIIKNTNVLRKLEKRLQLLSADIESRVSSSEKESIRIKKLEEETAFKVKLLEIRDRVQKGMPFEDLMVNFFYNSKLTEELQIIAPIGVTPLTELKRVFPQLARNSLRAIHKNTLEVDTKKRLISLLKEKLGTRSLVPREGSDPDAILSRVEALIKEDRLEDALKQINSLPTPGLETLTEWIEQATNWILVDKAITEISIFLSEEQG